SSGLLSGTPTVAGSFPLKVKVQDARSLSFTVDYVLEVAAPTLVLSPASLPQAKDAEAYSVSFSAAGGTAGYTFVVGRGALPPGLTLSSAGVLAGTPTTPVTASFSVTATDALGFT